MEQKYDLKGLFLKEFVKELIRNTKPRPLPTEISEEEIKPTIIPEKEMIPSQLKIEKPVQIIHVERTISPRNIPHPLQRMRPSPKPISQGKFFPRPETKMPINYPIPPPTTGEIDLGKINLLAKDTRVESIECQGPNKNILVKKNGLLQRTNISLTETEINKIIKNFSEKTRIPLIGGAFKAAFGNLIITAVISEYVGSRFILQRKRAFQPISLI